MATDQHDSMYGTHAEQAHSLVTLDGKDLPAFCPNPKMTLWNQHPRVYLDVAPTGEAMCPYCGTKYRLRDGATVRGH